MMILADLISLTIIFMIPLMLVALGGMVSERSGIINIALEGIMILGALVGTIVLNKLDGTFLANQFGVLLAILIAGVIGAIFSLLLAFASIKLKADQTIGGTALNIMAPALAIVVTWTLQGEGQTTIKIPTDWVPLTRLPMDANFFEVIFMKNSYLTTIVAVILFVVVSVIIYKTKFGLRLRACGEHPQAADSLGVNVSKMRFLGVVISGFLAGVGGLSFIMATSTSFASDVAGYGFLALAVMIFGNWKPIRIFLSALLFAFFIALSGMAGTIPFLPKFNGVNQSFYIYLILPYLITLIILTFTSKKSKGPKSAGIPYDKGLR